VNLCAERVNVINIVDYGINNAIKSAFMKNTFNNK